MVSDLCPNWLSPEFRKGMTEVSPGGWSHLATWAPSDNNFAVRMSWPRAEGVDCSEKSEHSRPKTVMVRKTCWQV